MRKLFATVFKFIAKSIAAFFAILSVIATVLVLLLVNSDHTLLNAKTYKRALAEDKVYEQLPALVAEQLSLFKDFLANPCADNPLGCAMEGAPPELQTCLTNALGPKAYEDIGTGQRKPTEAELQASRPCLDQFGGGGSQLGSTGGSDVAGPMTFLNNLTSDQWQALIAFLLPPDELQQMTEAMLDQAFAYFNGETDSVSVSLLNLKARLTGQSGRDLILLLLNAQPSCTEEQQAQIKAGNFGGQDQPPVLCAPTGETLDKLLPELQSQLNEAASRIPEQATLVKPSSASNPSNGPLGNDPQAALQKINLGIRLSPLLPLALLLLIALFGVRSFKGWLRWWGIPLFIAGVIALIVGIAIRPMLDWAWVNYAVARIPSMFSASSLVTIGHDMVDFAARELAKWIMLEAGLIALLGLGAIIGSFYIKPKPIQAAPLEAQSPR